MRIAKPLVLAGALVMVLGVVPGAPADAQQMPHRAQCHKLTQQIARYERDVQWAQQRDNALWEESTLAHIDRLAARRERLCPGVYTKPNPLVVAGRVMGELVNTAAKLARSYFLRGL